MLMDNHVLVGEPSSTSVCGMLTALLCPPSPPRRSSAGPGRPPLPLVRQAHQLIFARATEKARKEDRTASSNRPSEGWRQHQPWCSGARVGLRGGLATEWRPEDGGRAPRSGSAQAPARSSNDGRWATWPSSGSSASAAEDSAAARRVGLLRDQVARRLLPDHREQQPTHGPLRLQAFDSGWLARPSGRAHHARRTLTSSLITVACRSSPPCPARRPCNTARPATTIRAACDCYHLCCEHLSRRSRVGRAAGSVG